MTYVIRSTGALAVLWLGALATTTAQGQNTAQSHPADATAPVPPTRYVPMPMPNAHTAAPTSPAENWKALNESVAAYDSMSLTMENMEMAAPVAPAGADAAAPTMPAMTQPASKIAPAPAQSPAPEAHPHHMMKEVK